MELIGRPTINPLLFYSGKILGYATWILLGYSLSGNNTFISYRNNLNSVIAYFTLALGLIFMAISFFNLGKSTRLGLPSESTVLKTGGIYKYSRNPMYVGFNLFTITAMVYTVNIIVILLGLYSIVVYHLIIKSEEKFLSNRFGNEYVTYTKRVRRYL